MPFDPERVLALGAVCLPRAHFSPRLSGAGDDIAEHLERIGLRVERRESPPPWGRALAFLVFLVLGCWLGVSGTRPGTPWPLQVCWFVLILIAVHGASVIAARRIRSAGPPRPSRHVIGTLPTGKNPPVRVVLATLLRSPPSRRVNTLIAIVLLLFVAFGIVPWVPWFGALIRARPVVGFRVLSGQWLSVLFLIFAPKGEATRPIPGDNRTGLALLVELARIWPKSLDTRAETLFVASPDGLGRLLPSLLLESKPTLLLLLDSPGVGPDLIVVGRGPATRLAETAARDLWVPHRRARSSGFERQIPCALRRAGLVCFGLSGVHGNRPIDPALLAATAQLVTEIALRWAKPSAASAQGASVARSSQNPG